VVGEFVSVFQIHEMFKRHERGVFLKGVMSFVVWKVLNNAGISAVIRNSRKKIPAVQLFFSYAVYLDLSLYFLQVTERRTSPDGQVA
jgi:hypothetical protein